MIALHIESSDEARLLEDFRNMCDDSQESMLLGMAAMAKAFPRRQKPTLRLIISAPPASASTTEQLKIGATK